MKIYPIGLWTPQCVTQQFTITLR